MDNTSSRNLWISLGLGLLSVLLLFSYTQEKNQELTKKFGATDVVVVAKVDILELQTIDETMIEVVEKPVDYIEPGAMKRPQELVGQVATVPIKKNEQILSTKILPPGPFTGLSLQISPGKRALTLPIDAMRGVAKLIKPGDRVDLIIAVDHGRGQNQKREVRTLMENVVVLATGLRIANELPLLYEKDPRGEKLTAYNLTKDTSFNSITIEANPLEAQKLVYVLATDPSKLFMTLRHPTDSSPTQAGTIGIQNILSSQNPAARTTSSVRAPSSQRTTSSFNRPAAGSNFNSLGASKPQSLKPSKSLPRKRSSNRTGRFKSL